MELFLSMFWRSSDDSETIKTGTGTDVNRRTATGGANSVPTEDKTITITDDGYAPRRT